MPHPFVLLMACIAVAAILSYVVPSGEFERRQDTATGRTVVVPGSYHAVPPSPLGPFQALIAVPKGMVDAGSVIFLIFLAGGAFSVIDATGAFKGAVHWLSERFRHQTLAIIPIVSLLFATGGIVEGMWEEIVALVPVLMLLARRVGFDALTVVAMSLGAAGVGSTFSPFNPFNVGIAQRLAELPLLSGMWFRIAVLVPALGLWVWATMRHASRTRVPPEDDAEQGATHLEIRHVLTLIALAVMFAIYVFGTFGFCGHMFTVTQGRSPLSIARWRRTAPSVITRRPKPLLMTASAPPTRSTCAMPSRICCSTCAVSVST